MKKARWFTNVLKKPRKLSFLLYSKVLYRLGKERVLCKCVSFTVYGLVSSCLQKIIEIKLTMNSWRPCIVYIII